MKGGGPVREKWKNFGKMGRYAFCILLVAAFFLLYEVRLFQWQVVHGDEFVEQARSDRTDVVELEAARGEILDRNGKVLAGNRTTYEVIYDALEMDYAARNSTILQVIDLLEERGETWRDPLPIALSDDEEDGETYRFLPGREGDVETLKSTLNLAEYATADQCMADLAETFNCQGFSSEDARTVASVRYAMVRDGFSRTNPYVIARDVSVETVAVISQRSDRWLGVQGRVAVTRYYGEDGALAPHVLGLVGDISREELDQAEEDGTAYDYENYENISGYKLNDTIGKWGLESVFESELRGQRGEKTLTTDETGQVSSAAVTTAPQEGHTVVTTLDSDLQRVANLSLKKNIEGNTDAKNCRSGAAVVLDVRDFGVLACASYPTYDLSTFYEDYERLAEDPREPQFNRALAGIYVPGSIFKPMVALAALQEGVIGAGTSYYCDPEKGFEYGEGEGALRQGCLCGGGVRDVYTGLAYSCNTYFANVGLDLGIRRMDAYAEYFGLGEKTGLELYEDSGIMTSRQEYLDRFGVEMPEGVTAQAAIGQADDMFTPMQLAAYCATIGNNGKRLATHFLREITDYSGEEVLETYQARELFDAELSADVVAVVKQGMMGSATYGTAKDVFADYPVSIACKTGTAETSSNSVTGTEPNISFICLAPAENPQIAVAVMLEYGNKGSWAKNVAKDILDQYFGYVTWDAEGNRYDQAGNMIDSQGEILRDREELEAQREREEEVERERFLDQLDQDAGETAAPVVSPAPSASPSAGPTESGRDSDIPTTPYTGESPAPAESPSPAPEPSPPASESPYYRPEDSG